MTSSRHLGPLAAVAVGVLVASLLWVWGRPDVPWDHRSTNDKVKAVATQLRCPTCDTISAWASDSPAAWQVKDEIRALVQAGHSEQDILSYMTKRYGDWILLSPPAKGAGLLAWLAPPIALGIGTIWLVRFWRRHRPSDTVADASTRSEPQPNLKVHREDISRLRDLL